MVKALPSRETTPGEVTMSTTDDHRAAELAAYVVEKGKPLLTLAE
jgi:hypothetical protein